MNEFYTHKIRIDFHVLILKVVTIFFEPSLVIILKEFKCMCMSYIIIYACVMSYIIMTKSWIEI
jgi:hypothetical protein